MDAVSRAYRAVSACAMRRRMARDGKTVAAGAAAAPDKAALYDVGEDEGGMRLDRWLKRLLSRTCRRHI